MYTVKNNDYITPCLKCLIEIAAKYIENRESFFPEINLADIIASNRGWNPLTIDEEMIVHYGNKSYLIKRLEDVQ